MVLGSVLHWQALLRLEHKAMLCFSETVSCSTQGKCCSLPFAYCPVPVQLTAMQTGSLTCRNIPRNMAFHMIWNTMRQPCLQSCSWRSRQGWSWGQTLAGRRDSPWREPPCVSLRRELASMAFTQPCYCHLQLVSSEGQAVCVWCTCSCKTSYFLCYFSVCVYICVVQAHYSCLKNSACGIRIERNPQPVLWQTELEISSHNCLCFALRRSSS